MRFPFISSVAGSLLIGLVLLVPPSQAELVDRVGETVHKVVEPVSDLPSVPAPIPRQPNPAPPAPTSPPPSQPAPDAPSSTGPSTVTGSVQGVADKAVGTVRSAAGTGRSVASRPASSAPAASGGTSGRTASSRPLTTGGPSGGPPAAGPSATVFDVGPDGGRIRSEAGLGGVAGGRPASVAEMTAYVWPAVSLGGAAGTILSAALGLPFATGALPSAPELSRILSETLAATGIDGAAPTASSASPPAMPHHSSPYLPEQLPDSGEVWFILLLLLCLAPLTLFAYTIRRELKSMLRWPYG